MVEYTVVVSECDSAQTLSAALAARGVTVVLVPDIYHLEPGSAVLLELQSLEGPLVVFSDYFPRAVFWMLDALGITGVSTDRLTEVDGRPILCFQMSDKCCPDRWVEAVEELAGGFTNAPLSVKKISAEIEERWYPVLDYDRCNHCGACLEFCLFGVYDKENKSVIAADPGKCKPGCPACARVCPEQAIIFPLYAQDEAIAGSATALIRPFNQDLIIQAREKYEAGTVSVDDVISACGCENNAAPDGNSIIGLCDSECGDSHCCPSKGDAAQEQESDCSCDSPDGNDKDYFDGVIDKLGDE